MSDPRSIVVGGGLAGLTAAAHLVRQGHQVLVLDSGEHLGGRARSRHRDGYDLNLGPHALYRAGGGLAALRSLGVPVKGRMPRVDRAGVLAGGIVVPALHHLRQGTGDRRRVARALTGLGDRSAAAWAGRSAQEWVDSTTDDAAGRGLIESLLRTTTYAADLDLLDAGAATRQLRRAVHGVLYLHHGWTSLVTGLTQVVRAGGGTIRTRSTVVAVDHDDAGRGVHLASGEELGADHVVLALADPRQAARLLSGAPATALETAADDAVPVRMAHLDLALRPLPNPRFPNVFGVDEPIFITVPSSVATVAPGGGAVLHIARYLRPAEEAGDHRASLESVLDVAQPDWRDHVVDARYVPRSMVTGDHARRATLGTSGRPGVDVAGVDGLAVAGDWVGPQGLLADAAILSGVAAARHVVTTARRAVAGAPV